MMMQETRAYLRVMACQLKHFLAQADFMVILNELKTDPQSLVKHLQDDRVQLLLQELMRLNNPEVFKKREEEELARSCSLLRLLSCMSPCPSPAAAPARHQTA